MYLLSRKESHTQEMKDMMIKFGKKDRADNEKLAEIAKLKMLTKQRINQVRHDITKKALKYGQKMELDVVKTALADAESV